MKKLFIPFLFLLSLAACDKKNDTPKPKTNTELLTKASWIFNQANVGGTNVSAFLQTCQKDNILTFVSNGTGTVDEGGTKCNGGDPQSTPLTWSFLNNETQLQVSTILFTGGSNIYTIVTLSETHLVASQTITISGTPQNVTVTFLH